ncbi:chemotaxis protein [Acinetobacter sp. MD2]|uniref:chemotaxis protein n=1 Tax=Acinetobacter sp. MD2 TaxID=2600066 RepID=UPI002D1F11B1|nr:chemotaxis protein [Acinetobacter sp. MD2]MEB3767923.1 chemotaxis protein [Acinetobacter sp. MD2]
MSYQSAIHFDPTALLIIKNEIDNSIAHAEATVATLVEEQQLPFGIDDALLQLQQCAKILQLIDLPILARITSYSAEIMHNIMQHPTQIAAADVEALSEGLAILKRYVEFSCLQQVMIPQFLLEALNHLERALKKPLTREGHQVSALLECVEPTLSFDSIIAPEPSQHVHALYKLCLLHACTGKITPLDEVGFKLIGQHVAFVAQNTAHTQYWGLVNIALQHLNESRLTQPRLRVLIQLESQIKQLFQVPSELNYNSADLADIITLCLSQDHNEAEQLRAQLNLNDDVLSDNQLHFYYKKLFGPAQLTIQTICNLLSEDITTLRKEIEFNYLTLSDERFDAVKQQLQTIIHVLNVLNMTKTAEQIQQPLSQLRNLQTLQDASFIQSLMNSLMQALNDLGLLNRQVLSDLLKYPVHNTEIALDRLDNAHETLALELKAVLDLTHQTLMSYAQTQSLDLLENLPNLFKEMSGALLFMLDNPKAAQAFLNCSAFIEQQLAQQQQTTTQNVQYLLDVCASADMLLESRANQHPVMHKMFDVALTHSQKLQSAA